MKMLRALLTILVLVVLGATERAAGEQAALPDGARGKSTARAQAKEADRETAAKGAANGRRYTGKRKGARLYSSRPLHRRSEGGALKAPLRKSAETETPFALLKTGLAEAGRVGGEKPSGQAQTARFPRAT